MFHISQTRLGIPLSTHCTTLYFDPFNYVLMQIAKHSTILSYYTLLNTIPHKFFWYAPDSNAAMWRLQLRTSMELNLVQCDGAVLRF